MRLTRYADLAAYVSRAEPFLLAREAEHCFALGLLTTLQRGERESPTPPYMALIEDDDGRVVAAPLATPPFYLILSHIAPGLEVATDDILRLIVADAHDAMPDLPGVQGPDALARACAAVWQRLTGQSAHIFMRERLFRLERVRPQRAVPGNMRRIEETDRALLREWLRAFSAEALSIPNDPMVESQIDRRLRFKSSGLYLWQVGESAVSLAGYGGPTPHGIRIGPVYTPPEARGQGYASALVAALSQRLLDEGRQFLYLFTDLANPTSNHIYQEIGYEPVSDVTIYAFRPAP